MIEQYNYLFDMYLKMVKDLYNPDEPYKNLNKCIKSCEYSQWELLGMLKLMEVMNEISSDERDKEVERISETFCSIRICHAYMTDGEVIVFAQG